MFASHEEQVSLIGFQEFPQNSIVVSSLIFDSLITESLKFPRNCVENTVNGLS